MARLRVSSSMERDSSIGLSGLLVRAARKDAPFARLFPHCGTHKRACSRYARSGWWCEGSPAGLASLGGGEGRIGRHLEVLEREVGDLREGRRGHPGRSPAVPPPAGTPLPLLPGLLFPSATETVARRAAAATSRPPMRSTRC